MPLIWFRSSWFSFISFVNFIRLLFNFMQKSEKTEKWTWISRRDEKKTHKKVHTTEKTIQSIWTCKTFAKETRCVSMRFMVQLKSKAKKKKNTTDFYRLLFSLSCSLTRSSFYPNASLSLQTELHKSHGFYHNRTKEPMKYTLLFWMIQEEQQKKTHEIQKKEPTTNLRKKVKWTQLLKFAIIFFGFLYASLSALSICDDAEEIKRK